MILFISKKSELLIYDFSHEALTCDALLMIGAVLVMVVRGCLRGSSLSSSSSSSLLYSFVFFTLDKKYKYMFYQFIQKAHDELFNFFPAV